MVHWPVLLGRAVELLRGLDCRRATAADWRQFLVGMLESVDGRPYVPALSNLSDSPVSEDIDIEWLCLHVRMVRRLDPGEEPGTSVTVYELGQSQRRYMLLPEEQSLQRLEEMMLTIRDVGAVLLGSRVWAVGPAASQEGSVVSREPTAGIPGMESLVVKVIAMSQAICGSSASRCVGLLARRLLSLVEHRCGEAVWDSCGMRVLTLASPDLGHHVAALSSWPAGDVRRRFGMSPVWVAAFASMWDSVSPERRTAVLRCGYPEFLHAAEQCSRSAADPRDWVCLL